MTDKRQQAVVRRLIKINYIAAGVLASLAAYFMADLADSRFWQVVIAVLVVVIAYVPLLFIWKYTIGTVLAFAAGVWLEMTK